MQENNILELVLVTDSYLLREGSVGEKLTSCDHHFIRFSIRTEYELIEKASKIPYYRKANINLACELLPPATWEHLDLPFVDNMWNIFRNKLLEGEKTTVTVKTRRTNSGINPPWVTT